MPKKNVNAHSYKTFKNAAYVIALVIIICAVLYFALDTSEQSGLSPSDGDGGTQLEIMIMDVGQGDCILVVFETGETMLIDASTKSSAETIINRLDSRGIEKIDIMVATHPHADHIGGMEDIVMRYDIGVIYMPDMQSSSKTYKELIAAIDGKGIPVTEAYAGLDFTLGPSL
ncbi:MAG: MBL fold metallo-hydrolase, partial [Christensenellales bacterium]